MFSCLGGKEKVVLHFRAWGSQLFGRWHFRWSGCFMTLLWKWVLFLLFHPGLAQGLRSVILTCKILCWKESREPSMGNAKPPASCYCCLFGDGLRCKNKSDLSVFALLNFLHAGLVLCSFCISCLAHSTHGAADETGFHPCDSAAAGHTI